MMKNIQQVKAFAKLNLTLDVLGKRDDGFHELITIMQAIDLYDEISIEFTSKKPYPLRRILSCPKAASPLTRQTSICKGPAPAGQI